MNQKKCFVKLTEIEKVNFSFYGNECIYSLEVYSPQKQLIGTANICVVQGGTDYSSAFDHLYDYDLSDDNDRQTLAEELGVDAIAEEWLDDDGAIDTSLLPKEICESLVSQYDSELLDWYYEEFSERADDEGFMPLEEFADNYTFGEVGSFKEMDLDLSLPEMFDKIYPSSWYEPEDIPTEILAQHALDMTTSNGQKILAELTSFLKAELENMDMISSYVNVSFGGDYSREKEALELFDTLYPKLAEKILSEWYPLLDFLDEQDWIAQTSAWLTSWAIETGCLYPGSSPDSFEDLASDIYQQETKATPHIRI